jgi:indoleamine 2,3-dioxygenase
VNLQWLPNQLSAVMDLMLSIYETYLSRANLSTTVTNESEPRDDNNNIVAEYQEQLDSMMEQVRDQRERLAREVVKWCQERGV